MNVGRHTYGHEHIKIYSFGEQTSLSIGSFCSIGSTLYVYLGGNHRTDRVTTYPFGHINQNIFNSFSGEGHPVSNGNVVIKNDVWIGCNSTIMSGVTIGNGAVVAANSHVIRDVPDYAMVGGNPATFIKYRFSIDQIEKLLKIEWWNFSDTVINELACKLCSTDIDGFITVAGKYKK
jgi:Acetyltransferase (isoleucine patch superfamily)